MQNTTGFSGAPQEAWVPGQNCTQCGKQLADWVQWCVHCGQRATDPEKATRAELGHIAYLLHEMTGWAWTGLLTSEAAIRLREQYVQKQQHLTESLNIPSAAPSRVRPVVPDLPPEAVVHTSPVSAPLPATPVPNTMAQRYARLSGSNASGSNTSFAAPPDIPDRPGVLRRFFQEHALHILFTLAAVLVLAALRSMLAWEWMDVFALRLIPMVPVALTLMFWIFGQKTRAENVWAAFVYHGLAAAMAGFDVMALNKYWFGNALGLKPILLTALLTATMTSGVLLRKWREAPYLHLFHSGVLATLFFALQMLRVDAPPNDFRPEPLWLFCGAYLILAGVCFALAKSWATRTLWGHLSALTAALLAALNVASQSGSQMEDFALMTLVAGLIYGVSAQMLREPRMIYAAGTFLVGSGVMWLFPHGNMALHGIGVLLLVIGAFALTLSTYNARLTAAGQGFVGMAEAYRHLALCAVVIATLLTWGLVAAVFMTTGPVALAETGKTALLALICGGYYLVFALREEKPDFVYAAQMTWAIGIVSALAGLDVPTGAYPLAFVGYGALLCLVSAQSRWSEALGKGGLVAATLGTVGAMLLPLRIGLPAAWLWSTLSLAGSSLLYAFTARRRDSEEIAFVSLFCASYSVALSVWKAAPFPVMLADCLAPAALIAGFTAWRLSLRPTTATSTGNSDAKASSAVSVVSSCWSVPLATLSLLAIVLSVGSALMLLTTGTSITHGGLSLLPVLTAAILTAASRREARPEALRTLTLGTLVLGAAVDAAFWLNLTQGYPHWTATQTALYSATVMALGWGGWLLGRGVIRRLPHDVWSEEIVGGGLATAFAGAVLAYVALSAHPGNGDNAILLAPLTLLGAFGLFCLHADRLRETKALWAAALIWGMAGLAYLPATAKPSLFLPFWTLACLVSAVLKLWIGRRLEFPAAGYLSLLPAAGGAALTLWWRHNTLLSPIAANLTDGLWMAGSVLLAVTYLRTAAWSREREFTTLAALFLTGGYMHAITLLFHPPPVWHALILLPLLAVLYFTGVQYGQTLLRKFAGFVPSVSAAETDGLFGQPVRRTALTLSVLALLWSSGNGDLIDGNGAHTHSWIVTLTILVYGAAYTVYAGWRRTAQAVTLGSVTLTAAYLHHLATFTPLLSGASATEISWPRFAFLSVQAGLVWMLFAWRIAKRYGRSDLAAPLLTLAGSIALFSAVVGVLTVQTPGEGRWTVMALAWAGVIWFGLWHLEQGESCLHVGVWNLLGAWMLVVHDQVHGDLTMLDLYLLPVGVYLITIGHLASHRKRLQQAQQMWWAGLLLTITPAFLAYWHGASALHTILLLLECLFAILWGIGQRIRAFICVGMAFVAAFGASNVVGHLPDTWGTFASLLIGLTLFVIGFYALTHKATVRRWADFWETQWQAWQGWR